MLSLRLHRKLVTREGHSLGVYPFRQATQGGAVQNDIIMAGPRETTAKRNWESGNCQMR